jgi:hypothetical protein
MVNASGTRHIRFTTLDPTRKTFTHPAHRANRSGAGAPRLHSGLGWNRIICSSSKLLRRESHVHPLREPAAALTDRRSSLQNWASDAITDRTQPPEQPARIPVRTRRRGLHGGSSRPRTPACEPYL